MQIREDSKDYLDIEDFICTGSQSPIQHEHSFDSGYSVFVEQSLQEEDVEANRQQDGTHFKRVCFHSQGASIKNRIGHIQYHESAPVQRQDEPEMAFEEFVFEPLKSEELNKLNSVKDEKLQIYNRNQRGGRIETNRFERSRSRSARRTSGRDARYQGYRIAHQESSDVECLGEEEDIYDKNENWQPQCRGSNFFTWRVPFEQETRLDKLERYREKKIRRCWGKRISYQSRKCIAERRTRVQGKFAPTNPLMPSNSRSTAEESSAHCLFFTLSTSHSEKQHLFN